MKSTLLEDSRSHIIRSINMTCIFPPHLRAFFHLLHLTLQQPTLFHNTARTIHDQRTMEDNDTTASLSLEATTPHPDHRPPALAPAPAHPSTHRLRKAFFRASALLHAAYSTWRTHTYDQALTAHLHTPSTLHLVHDPALAAHDAPYDLCELALYPFPGSRIPDARARAALLATCMCEDAAVVMADMIERVVGRASSPPLPPGKKKNKR